MLSLLWSLSACLFLSLPPGNKMWRATPARPFLKQTAHMLPLSPYCTAPHMHSPTNFHLWFLTIRHYPNSLPPARSSSKSTSSKPPPPSASSKNRSSNAGHNPLRTHLHIPPLQMARTQTLRTSSSHGTIRSTTSLPWKVKVTRVCTRCW